MRIILKGLVEKKDVIDDFVLDPDFSKFALIWHKVLVFVSEILFHIYAVIVNGSNSPNKLITCTLA